MYKEIMMNDDNLESNLLTSSLLKMCCLVQDLLQVELCAYCPVAGDELTRMCSGDLTLQVNYSAGIDSIGYHSLPGSVMDNL